jgi:hypothetical protein
MIDARARGATLAARPARDSELVALTMFAAASRTPAARPARDQRSYLWAYRGLVVFLAGSVVGAGLAEALPWQ